LWHIGVAYQPKRAQLASIVQLGHDRDEWGGNEAIPSGARQTGFVFGFITHGRHPDRWPCGGGVRHRDQEGRSAQHVVQKTFNGALRMKRLMTPNHMSPAETAECWRTSTSQQPQKSQRS